MNKKGKRYDHLTDCFSLCCFEKNRLTSRINVWPIKMITSWCHQRLRVMTRRFGRPLGIFFVQPLFIFVFKWSRGKLGLHHRCPSPSPLNSLRRFVFRSWNAISRNSSASNSEPHFQRSQQCGRSLDDVIVETFSVELELTSSSAH